MKKAVLDTHALIWHLSNPKKLGKDAQRILRLADQNNAIIFIPAIVAVELTLIREAGRQVIGPAELQSLIDKHPSFEIAPLNLKQATEFVLLSSIKDPFDRLIIATARTLGVPLLSADEKIQNSGLTQIIW